MKKIYSLDSTLRSVARRKHMPVMDLLLHRISEFSSHSARNYTLFAVCPNSVAVIRAALRAAKRANAPLNFAATLNQVDVDGGYTGFTQREFVKLIRQEAAAINFTGPVIIAVDHGGPWLRDNQRTAGWPYEKTMKWVKKSFEAALLAGYDLLHVDPTIDITMTGSSMPVDLVISRTIELIDHIEGFRKKMGIGPVAYEVGTEEVHGGLADMTVFTGFLRGLKSWLQKSGYKQVWPCFIVGKVGTDLHTTVFDSDIAAKLVSEAHRYGSWIKGHYTDNVDNPEAYPISGMGAANVGPEFTESEYEALIELENIESQLFSGGKIPRKSKMKQVLWQTVLQSNRWQKWLKGDEIIIPFERLDMRRQEWLIKTGCRYIWANPEVQSARMRLYQNLSVHGIRADDIVMTAIEKKMHKYFTVFNLVDLNEILQQGMQ